MKVLVIGGIADRSEVIDAIKRISNKERVEFIDAGDIENDDDLELVQFDPLTGLSAPQENCWMDNPKLDNRWRGGSRGKGGKTKWPRR